MAIRPLHVAREANPRRVRSEADLPADVSVGAEIRSLRKARGLTLKEVAAEAGISLGYLSEIERDLTRVPIAVLRRLCDVFGVSIGWLLGVAKRSPDQDGGVVVRADERTRLTFPGLGISEELLSPDLAGPLEMLISTFEPGADSDDYTHEGHEAGLVIEGVLDLWVDGEHHRLKRGDSFSFASTRVHRCANSTARVARVLWVITPPHY